jgi:hypothetical protein
MSVNRLEYYYSGNGELYVQFCQELAKRLYIKWDAPLGGIGDLLTGQGEGDWQVFPCGRVEDTEHHAESVWNDQIIIEAIARVNMR